MKIHYLHFDKYPGPFPGACQLYRGNMPATCINDAGRHQATWGYVEDVVRAVTHDPKELRKILSNDIIVLGRGYVHDGQSPEVVEDFFSVLRANGAKLVAEYDDDMTNKHRRVIGGEYLPFAKAADGITVTTQRLADIIFEDTGIKPFVWGNSIRDEVVKVAQSKKISDAPQVLLSGSPTHSGDWQVIKEVAFALREKGFDVATMGYSPLYLRGIRHIEPRPYHEYIQYVASATVVWAPLNKDGFNLGKSPIKIIEASAFGTNWVASKHPVYKEWGTPEAGMFAETADEFYDKTLRLLTDKVLAENMKARARKLWKSKSRMESTIQKLENFYQNLIRRGSNGV